MFVDWVKGKSQPQIKGFVFYVFCFLSFVFCLCVFVFFFTSENIYTDSASSFYFPSLENQPATQNMNTMRNGWEAMKDGRQEDKFGEGIFCYYSW